MKKIKSELCPNSLEGEVLVNYKPKETQRQWRLSPHRAHRFIFTSDDLANLFVSATCHWYRVEKIAGLRQELFGKAAQVKQAIVDYLETGRFDTTDFGVEYAVDKFRREWMGEDGSSTGTFQDARLPPPNDGFVPFTAADANSSPKSISCTHGSDVCKQPEEFTGQTNPEFPAMENKKP